MRILLVSTFFPPYLMGGTEQSAEQLALHLANAGEKVALFTFDYGKGTCAADDPPYQVFAAPLPAAFQQSERLRFRVATLPGFIGYYAASLRRAIEAFAPDVVHVQDKLALPAAALAKQVRPFPLAFTVRDYGLLCTTSHCLMTGYRPSAPCGPLRQLACARDFLQSRNQARTFAAFARYTLGDFPFRLAGLYQARLALKAVDGLVFISEALKQLYDQAQVLPPWLKGEVLYNFPPDPLPLSRAEKRALRRKLGVDSGLLGVFVGKLSPGKGAVLLMQALTELLPLLPDLHFACAGDLTDAVRPLVPQSERLHLLGKLPYAEVLALMAAADFVVYPSLWPEPHGRVPLEALAQHTPLITTRSGGIPETVREGSNALLVPPGSKAALVEAIHAFCTDEKLRTRLKRSAARGNKPAFAPQRLLARYLAFYGELSRQ